MQDDNPTDIWYNSPETADLLHSTHNRIKAHLPKGRAAKPRGYSASCAMPAGLPKYEMMKSPLFRGLFRCYGARYTYSWLANAPVMVKLLWRIKSNS